MDFSRGIETSDSTGTSILISSFGSAIMFLAIGKLQLPKQRIRNVIIDLDKNGRIIGIEVLDASKNLGRDLVTKILNTEKIAATA